MRLFSWESWLTFFGISQRESAKTAQQMIHEVAEWMRRADVKESAKFLYLLRACKFVPEETR